MMQRGGYRILTILCAIVVVVALVATVTFKIRTATYDAQLSEVEAEIDRRLGIAPLDAEDVRVAAPFVTWADLVEALHRAGVSAGLSEFGYTTQQAHGVGHPSESIPDDTTEPVEVVVATPAAPDSVDPVAESPAAYTAMTAIVEGSGAFGAITYFVELLGASDLPVTLDRLEIEAGRLPSFTAHVHLDSALPLAAAVAADREGEEDRS